MYSRPKRMHNFKKGADNMFHSINTSHFILKKTDNLIKMLIDLLHSFID